MIVMICFPFSPVSIWTGLLLLAEVGFLSSSRYLIHDRDSKSCESFDTELVSSLVLLVPDPSCRMTS